MEFLLIGFATYALTYALVYTDGPFGIFQRLRALKHSKLIDCFTCSSIWIGLLLALITATDIGNWFILGIAGAGLAIFLDGLDV